MLECEPSGLAGGPFTGTEWDIIDFGTWLSVDIYMSGRVTVVSHAFMLLVSQAVFVLTLQSCGVTESRSAYTFLLRVLWMFGTFST